MDGSIEKYVENYTGDDYPDENYDPNQNYDGEDDFNQFDDEEHVLLPGVDDVPLFANPDAIKLDQEVKDKGQKIQEIGDKIADMKERVKVMKEHFRNVQQELDHTNALNSAKQAEIKTESHMRQLATRALGKSKHDSSQLQTEVESVQDQINSIQNLIYKANEGLDEFKMQMNWNQEELEQWAVAARQKEDDNLAMQKYTRADEMKIKEYTFQLELLTKDALKCKERLDNEITDTQAKQMELDRIATDFKIAHSERQTLISRWQEIIEEMKKRDIEINQIGERFAKAKSERLASEAVLEVQKKRLVTQQGENKEVEVKSEGLVRVVARKREELLTGNKKQQDLKDELESLKNELTTAAEDLLTKRSENANKNHLIDDRRVALERERQKYQTAKDKLEQAKDSTYQAEVTAREAEEALAATDREMQGQLSKLKVLKEKLLKESQTVHELKRKEARLRTEIIGTKSTSKNMDVKLHGLDKEASRQQELLYNAEFQIQQIERKVSRGMGERSDDEKRQLKVNIELAEQAVEEVKEKRKLLQTQVRKISNELVNAKVLKEKTAEKKVVLKEKLSEREIENKMMEEEIKRDVKGKEEMTVMNDLLRLDVKRLKDLLSAKADAVFSLENRRQQLMLSMEERKTEIAVHRDVLKAELKNLLEEKHKITIDLNNRQAQVDKLKARFEAVARSADQEGHSQSYYIIQAAQKREELQRRGDELDHQIRVAERELRAQQLTLDHLTARNSAFRDSFKKMDVNGEDSDVLKQLEERSKLGKDALFRKKKELQRLNNDIDEDQRRLDQVKSQHARVAKQREHLENAKVQVEEELLNQQQHLEDFSDKISKMSSKHRIKSCGEKGVEMAFFENGTLEEKTVHAEVIKDCIQNVLYTLGQLSTEFPEVADFLSSKLKEADLRVPAKPPSRAPTAGNTGSLASSTASGSRTGTGTGAGAGGRGALNGGPSLGSVGSSAGRGNIVQPRTMGLDI